MRWYLAPSLGAQDIPVELSDAQLCAVAKIQQTLSRKHGLNMCIGGDIELTTITAEGIETTKIGEYPDKAIMERRMASAKPSERQRAAA